MSQNSAIEWTQATWNCLAGCSEISPGKINTDEEALSIPLLRKKPTTYFVNSMSDLFHEDVPDDFIDKVFAVINATSFTLPADPVKSRPWHTYQILTKRAERMCEYMHSRSTRNFATGKHPIFDAGRGDGGPLRGFQRMYGAELMNAGAVLSWPPSNAWLGVSVENRQHGLPRIEHLLRTPAAVRFLSVEPLLEDLGQVNLEGISWCIVGGESGHGARPMHADWVRSIRDQCVAAGVPFFMKQWGEFCPVREWICREKIGNRFIWRAQLHNGDEVDGEPDHIWLASDVESANDSEYAAYRLGKKAAGRLLDGRTWDEMPVKATVRAGLP